jgi:hypothetical protein
MPKTEQDWKNVAKTFQDRWNFPHCVGALDGKHVLIQKPLNSGSDFFNYKHNFSIILLALVDADCKFLYVDVGAQGRLGDAGVFNNSKLSKLLEDKSMHIPEPENIMGIETPLPYMIVADDAFPLRTYIMKPFHKKNLSKQEDNFNYRLSRARRVVENAFGILATRFRIFRTPIILNIHSNVKKIVLTATILHNMLTSRSCRLRDDEDEDIDMNVNMAALQALQPLNYKGRQMTDAKVIRDTLAIYFSNEGQVPWQQAQTEYCARSD